MSALAEELIRIIRHFGVFEREAVCCGTVSVPQCLVLQQLRHTEPQGMSSLAASAGSSLSAMTRLVDGLLKRGWVERQDDPADRRKVVIALTDTGRHEAAALWRHTETFFEQVLERVPAAERQSVCKAVTTLRTAMEAMDPALCCLPRD